MSDRKYDWLPETGLFYKPSQTTKDQHDNGLRRTTDGKEVAAMPNSAALQHPPATAICGSKGKATKASKPPRADNPAPKKTQKRPVHGATKATADHTQKIKEKKEVLKLHKEALKELKMFLTSHEKTCKAARKLQSVAMEPSLHFVATDPVLKRFTDDSDSQRLQDLRAAEQELQDLIKRGQSELDTMSKATAAPSPSLQVGTVESRGQAAELIDLTADQHVCDEEQPAAKRCRVDHADPNSVPSAVPMPQQPTNSLPELPQPACSHAPAPACQGSRSASPDGSAESTDSHFQAEASPSCGPLTLEDAVNNVFQDNALPRAGTDRGLMLSLEDASGAIFEDDDAGLCCNTDPAATEPLQDGHCGSVCVAAQYCGYGDGGEEQGEEADVSLQQWMEAEVSKFLAD